jgi:hypothetical protein
MISFRLTVDLEREEAAALAAMVVAERGIVGTWLGPTGRQLSVDARGLAGVDSLYELADHFRSLAVVTGARIRRIEG